MIKINSSKKIKASRLMQRVLRNLPDNLMEDRYSYMGLPDTLEDSPSEELYDERDLEDRVRRRKRDVLKNLSDEMDTQDNLEDPPSVRNMSEKPLLTLKPSLVIVNEVDIKDKIIEFFKNNPNPPDSKIHKLSEDLNIDTHELETMIYQILTEKLNA